MTTLQAAAKAGEQQTVIPILCAISVAHLLNDSMQAIVPALYPILQEGLHLSMVQLGMIGFMLNMTSSVMQPIVGFYSDKRTLSNLLPLAMVFSLLGLIGLAVAPSYPVLLSSVILIGLGSAVFHPEASRVVYFTAGKRRAFAQSLYQVGGNTGTSLGPVLTALLFVPLGQFGAIWGAFFALFAFCILCWILPWYKKQLKKWKQQQTGQLRGIKLDQLQAHRQVLFAMSLLIFLIFTRSWYHTSISSFYQFYLKEHYGLFTAQAQIPIFIFLASGVLGTFFGGIIADKIGMKNMIVLSIAGAAPFSLLLPYLPLYVVYPMLALLGFILLSGFSVVVVYAQFLMPNQVGLASGLTVGFAFGLGAIGGVMIGQAIDMIGLNQVMFMVSFLPLTGLLALFLPSDRGKL